jgi:uncharacterized protein (TIGR02246 family)
MNRNHLLVWIAGFAMLALVGCAQESAAPEAFPQETADAWLERYRANDAAGMAALYTEDAQLLPPDGELVSGRAAIQEFMGAASLPAGATFEIEATETLMFGEHAWRQGIFRYGGAADGLPATGKFMELWKKVDGKWLHHREIWNTDAPIPVVPASVADTDEPA